jgi:hypothetical protein
MSRALLTRTGGFARQPMQIVRFTHVDSMRNNADLMRGAQAFGQCLHRLGAAGGQMHIAAFFGECFGGRSADAPRRAGDQHALAAQKKIDGLCSLTSCVAIDRR